MPSADPDEPCQRRWGIENGYKLLKQTRMRTPGRDENVRIFCFVVSLMVHNAWTMLHSDRGGGGRRQPEDPGEVAHVSERAGGMQRVWHPAEAEASEEAAALGGSQVPTLGIWG